MRYNVQYVNEGGELTNVTVESHDVRSAIRDALLQFPDATRIFQCVPSNLDNLEGSTEQTLG